MHSTIFQICESPIREKLKYDTLEQGGGEWIDYCYELKEEQQKERIEMLVNELLPKGMFLRKGKNAIEYMGGLDEWKKDWAKKIKECARKIDANNILDFLSPLYELRRIVKNPLDIGSMFYMDAEALAQSAYSSGEFFLEIVKRLKKGDRLYIGGVIGYHY